MDPKVKQKLDKAWREPENTVAAWKERTGGKAIGLALTDVPEELVHAAGALPTVLLGADISLQNAEKHFQGFSCSYSRGILELYERGDLGHLDGLVIPYACDVTRCLDLVFKYVEGLEFYDCLRIPRREKGAGVEKYFVAEMKRLAENLAAVTGRPVTDEGLAASIAAYNKARGLLGELRTALREGDGVTLAELLSAVRASMVMAPEDSIPLLEEAVSGLSAAGKRDGEPRVVLAGKTAEPLGLAELIEQSGLQVVEDHLTVGGRWAQASVPELDDPWKALAGRQQARLPFAGIWDERPNRASYLLERVKELSADGAVFLVQKFCEPAELDYPGIKEELEKEGVSLLAIETDFHQSSLAAVRTRVEAFAEMLRSG